LNLAPIIIFLCICLCALLLIIYYQKFKKNKSPQTNAIFTEALNSMVRGEKSRTISLLKQVVKSDSGHVQAYLQLGNIIREENPEQAAKIHQSLTVRPNLKIDLLVDIHKSLAIDYETLGLNYKAKIEAEKILSIEKRNLWALAYLIKYSENEKEWDIAANLLKQLGRITGKNNNDSLAKLEVYKGLDKLKDGHFDACKIFFLKAIKLAPDYPESYKYLGNVYAKTRDLVKAIDCWESYALIDSRNGYEIYSKIESALFDLGRYSEVENFYKRVLENDKENFQAIICLANVLEEKGERVEALSLLDNFLIGKESDVRTDLMKLKLLIPTSTPIELMQQIDSILEKTLGSKID
jgi:lipopolysaccharide biosynthesis regulator YciM